MKGIYFLFIFFLPKDHLFVCLLNLTSFLYVLANEMRDEHHFLHVTDPEIARVYKVDVNSIAVFIPERFQSQFEPKKHVLKKVI